MRVDNRKNVLFMSDLDGTWLSKNPENRARLDREILEIRDEYESKGVSLSFGYITARPPQRVETENLPPSDWTVTYNGAQINPGDPGDFDSEGNFVAHEQNQAWVDKNAATGFSAEKSTETVRNLLQDNRFSNLNFRTVGQVVENPSADANPFTASLCFTAGDIRLTESEKTDANKNGTADIFEKATFSPPKQIQALISQLDHQLDSEGVGHEISPAYLFHGKPIVMFDVASPLANKGEALQFVQQSKGVDPTHTIVAGDGGNDIAMMKASNGTDEGRRVIIVGGDSKLVEAASSLRNAIIQPAEMDCSLGVLDGLRRHLDAIVLEP